MTGPKLYLLPARSAPFPTDPLEPEERRIIQKARLYDGNGAEFVNIAEVTTRPHPDHEGIQLVRIEMALGPGEVERIETPPDLWGRRDEAVKSIAASLARAFSVTTSASYQNLYEEARRVLDMEMPRPQSGPLTRAELEV